MNFITAMKCVALIIIIAMVLTVELSFLAYLVLKAMKCTVQTMAINRNKVASVLLLNINSNKWVHMPQVCLVKHLTFCLFFAPVIGVHAAQEPLIRQSSNKQVTPVQPKDDFTVTIVQTGPPSPEMLNRIPVKMTITNNTDRAFALRFPYLFNISACNADNSKFAKKILTYGSGIAAKDMATATGCVLLIAKAFCWTMGKLARRDAAADHINLHGEEPTSGQIAEFAMYCGIAIGVLSEITILIHALGSVDFLK
jgi:hypothetical protein